MKGRIVITPDGEVAVFTDEGTFAGGRDAITAFLQGLNSGLAANGLDRFASISPVEQHRHAANEQHAHTHDHGHEH